MAPRRDVLKLRLSATAVNGDVLRISRRRIARVSSSYGAIPSHGRSAVSAVPMPGSTPA
jgi:hypothetical protein